MSGFDCVMGLDHKWVLYVADGVVPYRFCEYCKKTLYCGIVYGFKK